MYCCIVDTPPGLRGISSPDLIHSNVMALFPQNVAIFQNHNVYFVRHQCSKCWADRATPIYWNLIFCCGNLEKTTPPACARFCYSNCYSALVFHIQSCIEMCSQFAPIGLTQSSQSANSPPPMTVSQCQGTGTFVLSSILVSSIPPRPVPGTPHHI